MFVSKKKLKKLEGEIKRLSDNQQEIYALIKKYLDNDKALVEFRDAIESIKKEMIDNVENIKCYIIEDLKKKSVF